MLILYGENLKLNMKKTKLNPIGKIGKRNLKANREIDKQLIEHDIRHCEIRIPHVCTIDSFLHRAHRHKRNWYKEKGREHLLHDFKQWVLACDPCHDRLEVDPDLTEEVFMCLRGSEHQV